MSARILERHIARGRDGKLHRFTVEEHTWPIRSTDYYMDGKRTNGGDWHSVVTRHRRAIIEAEHRARKASTSGGSYASALLVEFGSDPVLGVEWMEKHPAPLANLLLKAAGREETYETLAEQKKTPAEIAAELLPAIGAGSAEQSDEVELLPELPQTASYEEKRARDRENLRREMVAEESRFKDFDPWEDDPIGAESTAQALEEASWDRDTLHEGPALDDRRSLWGNNNEGGGTSGR